MIEDGLTAKEQITKFLQFQTEFPPFTREDWSRLEQISRVLSKFNTFTLEISRRTPQISIILPMYYELHDLLHDVSDQCGGFSDLDLDIVEAVKVGMKKSPD